MQSFTALVNKTRVVTVFVDKISGSRVTLVIAGRHHSIKEVSASLRQSLTVKQTAMVSLTEYPNNFSLNYVYKDEITFNLARNLNDILMKNLIELDQFNPSDDKDRNDVFESSFRRLIGGHTEKSMTSLCQFLLSIGAANHSLIKAFKSIHNFYIARFTACSSFAMKIQMCNRSTRQAVFIPFSIKPDKIPVKLPDTDIFNPSPVYFLEGAFYLFDSAIDLEPITITEAMIAREGEYLLPYFGETGIPTLLYPVHEDDLPPSFMLGYQSYSRLDSSDPIL